MIQQASAIDKSAVKQIALDLGFDLVGICEATVPPHLDAYRNWLDKGFAASMDYLHQHLALKQHPRELLPTARSIIAVALNYNQPNLPIPGQPRIARYALGRDYHKVLRAKLSALAKEMSLVDPGAEFRVCVDSAPIMERDFANLAGLGWFGKNTMLINSQRGSWFFIGLLLTSLELEADSSAIGGCGTCRACVDACPTGAIVKEDGRWQVDARRCISYLTIEHAGPIPSELQEQMGEWTFGCDVCQEVCPFNQPRNSQPWRATITREPDFLAKRQLPSLRELPQWSTEEWDIQTRGSAIRRAGLEGIRRNATINLQNARRAIKPGK